MVSKTKYVHHPASEDGTPPLPSDNPQGFYQRDSFSSTNNMGYLLKRAWTVLANAVEQEVAYLDLTYPQFVIMIKLYEGSCSTAAELAREVNTDTGAMTRMLARLECKKLIRRVRNPEDRRSFTLAVSELGQRILERAMIDAINVLNRYFSDFSDEEMALLNTLLRRIIKRGL